VIDVTNVTNVTNGFEDHQAASGLQARIVHESRDL
jgi:hypothetical protein